MKSGFVVSNDDNGGAIGLERNASSMSSERDLRATRPSKRAVELKGFFDGKIAFLSMSEVDGSLIGVFCNVKPVDSTGVNGTEAFELDATANLRSNGAKRCVDDGTSSNSLTNSGRSEHEFDRIGFNDGNGGFASR